MFLQNRNNFIKKMKPNTLALFYSGKKIIKSADQYFPFAVNHNFYYLTGINQDNVILLIVKTLHSHKTYLFLEASNSYKMLWDGDVLSFADASQISQINIFHLHQIESFSSFLLQTINPLRSAVVTSLDSIYFDLSRQNISLEQEVSWPSQYSQKLLSLYPFLKIYNSSPLLSSLRQSKSNYEQEQIKKAIHIHQQALSYLLTKIKLPMYEYQVTALFHYFLENKRTNNAFQTIAASGKNALILHYERNHSQLQSNDLLLLDSGVTYNHYSSDITRCYPVSGVFTSLQKKLYNLVLKANKELIAFVKPEHTFAQLNQHGKAILTQGLKELSLLEDGQSINHYCYHGLAHHLGLDIHDVCNYSDIIGENSIITIEPGLYLKKLNIGIRIEDNLLVTKDGAINLSQKIPKEINEIEVLMKTICNN
ncbi:aminopeptidase P N-terminal domain-containing protein ['Fragaria x ananassa' phyllody phytoplasma]|uniref:Xaa-Pro aminopeptidase n=1 Tax='Fragaria x ananassa' phyllody phytoplasma TaxID=2358428 RepID=A0ABS5K3J1_9MOLU|nr:aminopeptidase P family protein ['Fragaria x ananassa' phyllody phytoplasma]MBS2126344.1 aminopeptidase P N-terminal domain-containing protein ['Fragaria x ananassa' phyllody phytoplasma]